MKINLFLKKIITIVISFIFITQHTVIAATGINIENRTSEISVNISNSSTPSDLPVIGYSDFFDKEKVNLVQKLDLSSYIGKKVFVGYGIYDKNEDNCKFLEQPGVSNFDYESAFTLTKTSNQHTYGLSSARMTYGECLALGDKLGGYPVIVDSVSENYFINSEFTKKTINSTLIEKIWIGANMGSCTDVNYINAKGNVQYFEQFQDQYLDLVCTNDKLYLKQLSNGYFTKTSSEVPAYCVIEFDTEDMHKPLKVCASWWKVEREYQLETNSDFYKTNLLKRINQADIPLQMVVCSKYNADAVALVDSTAIRTAHCTEYYSATILPECVNDMYQAQCKVSECNGYIQNACRLKDSKTVGKGYVKGEVLLNGTLVEAKIKDKVITNEYECPVATMSNKYCEEEATVVIYPQECPLSQCTELKECVLSAGTDSTKLSTCYDTYPCTKIYGGKDILPKTDPVTGDVTFLAGKCPDAPVSNGEILYFPVNIQNKLTKKCVEYEILETEELIKQKCVLERSFIDYVVDTSITAEDNYADNPNCLRMDTSEESQVDKNLIFKIKNNNYFKNKVSKVYLDDTYETLMDSGNDNYLLYSAMPNISGQSVNTPQVSTETTTIGAASNLFGATGTTTTIDESSFLNCSAYDPAVDENGNVTSDWYNRNINVFSDGIDSNGNSISDPNLSLIEMGTTYATVNVSDSVINTEAECSAYAGLHGISSYVNYTYSKNPVNNIDYCSLNLTKFTADTFLSKISKINSTSLRYTFNSNTTGDDCLKKAYCLDGTYNESNFSSMQASNSCIVTTGEGSPESYDSYISDKILGTVSQPATNNTSSDNATKENCIPVKGLVTTSATIDGIENIIIVEDYTDSGGFGYYTNHNSWRSMSNEISVTTDSFSDKKLVIPEMSYITDYLSYHGIYKHESWKSKKPDVPASLMGGAVAGLAMYAISAAATAAGLAAGATATAAALAAGATATAATAAGTAATAASSLSFLIMTPLGIGLIVIVIIIILLILLGKSKSMDRQYTEYHIFKDIPNSMYYSGLYETRLSGASAFVEKQQSPSMSIDSNFIRMTYWHVVSDTGRQKSGPFLNALKMIFKNKRANMVCGGMEVSEVTKSTHPDELSINYGYPKCKWYKPGCSKVEEHPAELVSNSPMLDENITVPKIPLVGSSSTATNIDKLKKDISTVYLGAVNTMVVLVPFKGDYELKAFNKHDDLLSTRTIHEDSFAGVVDANGIEYAQVNFGLSMNLASGITEGDNTLACIKDKAVEWGGGVSGGFIEANRTDLSSKCLKSNDQYVKDNSMTKITIQPLNMDRFFTYKLTKPMPFANRVYLATLNDKEVRNYRCYDEFGKCDDGDFVQEASE